jgi:G3E family GTPase
MVVVLNKIDQFPPEARAERIEKMKTKLRGAALKDTKFKNAPIIPVSANPNAGHKDPSEKKKKQTFFSMFFSHISVYFCRSGAPAAPLGLNDLIQAMVDTVQIPKRDRF